MSKFNQAKRRTAHPKRGVTMLTALGGLALSLTVLAVVVDLGRLSLCRQRLQFAADAAALAAAAELTDTSVLYPGVAGDDGGLGSAGELRDLAAKVQAESYVANNVPANAYLGISQAPTLELTFGSVDSEGFREDELGTSAVEVKLAFSRDEGNGLSLLMARWFGGDNADVQVRSVAKLERSVVGFKVRDGASVPCMPFVLQCGDESNSWVIQAATKTNSAFNDRLRYEPLAGQTALGADGIPELVFTVSSDDTANSSASAWIATFGGRQADELVRQLKTGLNEADLAKSGGRLGLGKGNEEVIVSQAAQDGFDLESIVEELRSLQGQPRIWPLGRKREGGLSVEQFAAGRVVDCYLTKPGEMTVVIQPCVMQTSTAITDPGAPPNPWISKLELVY